MRKSYIILLLSVLALGCEALEPEPEPERNVVLYYVATHDNGLSAYTEENLAELKAGYLPSRDDKINIFLAYYHLEDQSPILSRFSRTAENVFVEDTLMIYPGNTMMSTKSLEKSVLKQVLADAEALYPAATRSFIMSTHGAGFLPESMLADTKFLGPDDDVYLDITDFASALGSYHYGVLIFDCCYMGSVEVAYQLRNVCDYMIGSLTEIMATGLTRSDIVEPLFTLEPEKAAVKVAELYMNHVRTEGEYSNAGTVGVVRSSGLDSLAKACKSIYSDNRSSMSSISRDSIQHYSRQSVYNHMFDLDDYVSHILTAEDGTFDQDSYNSFRSALNYAVIFEDSTPSFLGLPIDHHCGVSVYIKSSDDAAINSFYKTLDWNKATNQVY